MCGGWKFLLELAPIVLRLQHQLIIITECAPSQPVRPAAGTPSMAASPSLTFAAPAGPRALSSGSASPIKRRDCPQAQLFGTARIREG